MENSNIGWTTHTFNPWIGCARVSAGCMNCYAERLDAQYHADKPHWGVNAPRQITKENYWKQPLKWNKEAIATGIRPRVFCASMADVFEDRKDLIIVRENLFNLINNTPALDWLILTKRADKVAGMLPKDWGTGYKNVWLGFSAENQEMYNKRFPHFAHGFEAVCKFISCEPLLSDIWLQGKFDEWDFWSLVIKWVIVGGESGNDFGKFKYRPAAASWLKSIMTQSFGSIPAFWLFMFPPARMLAEAIEFSNIASL